MAAVSCASCCRGFVVMVESGDGGGQASLEFRNGRFALRLASGHLAVGGEVRVPLGQDGVRAVHRRAADLGFFVEILLREAGVGPLGTPFEEAGHGCS
ncbi:hypothetical protein ACWGCW_35750 [Streptomyces sp. NPDC054933]